MNTEILQILIAKLPTFDPAWPEEVKVKWFECLATLWRYATELERPKPEEVNEKPA